MKNEITNYELRNYGIRALGRTGIYPCNRGQLSVYMRLLDIAVPSIYGPSADAPGF